MRTLVGELGRNIDILTEKYGGPSHVIVDGTFAYTYVVKRGDDSVLHYHVPKPGTPWEAMLTEFGDPKKPGRMPVQIQAAIRAERTRIRT